MRSAAARLLLAGRIAFSSVGNAVAQTFPALTGRVVDAADIIPPDAERELADLLELHEQKTTNQVVVATVPSLDGQAIEEYGVALGRAWGIGQKDKDNGVILLVAPNEREVRYEVGYGLEGELTDAITKVIIEGSILPRFKAGDFPGGIRRGVEDVIAVLEGDAAAFAERAKQRVSEEDTLSSAISVLVFILFMFIFLSIFGRGRRRRGWGPMVIGGLGGSSFGGGGSGGFSGGGGSFGGGGASGRW
jgi:uncharacterized protein